MDVPNEINGLNARAWGSFFCPQGFVIPAECLCGFQIRRYITRGLQIPVNTNVTDVMDVLPAPCNAVTLHYSRPLSRGSKRFRFRFRLRFRLRSLLHHAACYCQGTDDSGNEGADGVNDNAPIFSV